MRVIAAMMLGESCVLGREGVLGAFVVGCGTISAARLAEEVADFDLGLGGGLMFCCSGARGVVSGGLVVLVKDFRAFEPLIYI